MKVDLKTPKGTIDYGAKDTALYEYLIDKTRSIFKLYGGVPIDTPTFELKSILLDKYGEDTKLIYDLKDNGGEICALRYDLTVPFSRYMSMNKLKKIKRYQIGKVYRRDQPSVKQGRLREFIQADFDIAGIGNTNLIDAELISCMNKILHSYRLGDYVIRISDKELLYGIFDTCNIEKSLYNTTASTIDKIDKHTSEEINKELEQKGLVEKQISDLNKYISKNGKEDLLDFLQKDVIYNKYKEVIDRLCEIYKFCKIMKCSDNLLFDLSLARGLDYYTGIILEGKYNNTDVGSVAGGGRYDNLIGSLGKSDTRIPCSGFSIGLSRIYSLCRNQYNRNDIDVYISAKGSTYTEERLELQAMLWEQGISLETFYNNRVNISEHKEYCNKKGIRILLYIDKTYRENSFVNLINLETNKESVVCITDLVDEINNLKRELYKTG